MTNTGVLHSGERRISQDELERRALRAASGFQSTGVKPGSAIALLLRNDFCFIEASFAATAMGAYAVPVNWHLSAQEVIYVLDDCDASVLIAHTDLLHANPAIVEHLLDKGALVLHVDTPAEVRRAFGVDDSACKAPARSVEWQRWLTRYEPLQNLHADLTQTMIYTSGTTGKPKGVKRFPQPRAQAAEFAKIRDAVYGNRPGARSIVPGPLYHSAPNSFGLRAARCSDCLVLMPRFDAQQFLQLVQTHRITNAFMVPTMLVRLLKLPQAVRDSYDLSSLEHIMIAAAPCSAPIKQAMIDWWGPVIHEFYGATEMGYMTLCNSEETLRRPGTVGKAIEGVTLKALDAEGHEVGVGEPGELYGKMALFPDFTYHNRADERAACARGELISCGDVGYFDQDGYLFLCDRRREMVISGGVNIYPAEIESVLVTMPGVVDCAVIGIPDDEFGERLLALIQPQPGTEMTITEEHVIPWLRERVASYKVPRQIEFRAELPRDDSGKIYKRRLREPYWRGRERLI